MARNWSTTGDYKDNEELDICASYGEEGNSSDMNTCNECKSVMYCNEKLFEQPSSLFAVNSPFLFGGHSFEIYWRLSHLYHSSTYTHFGTEIHVMLWKSYL